MKKFFYSVFAVATLLLATTSCSKEDDLTPGIGHDGKQVTYTVQIPGVEQSRAINPYNVNVGEGKLASKLVYAMYENDAHGKGVLATGFVNDADETKNETPDGQFTVSLTLAKNINYDILFMAYNPDNCAFDLDNGIDLKALTIDKDNLKANQEQYDAFVGKLVNQNIHSASNHVELKRPFAQVNAATTAEDLEAVANLKSEVTKSKIVVYQAPTTLNIFDNSVSGTETLTYASEDILTKYNVDTYPKNEDITVNNISYKYLAMAYVLAGAECSTHDVNFTFYRNDGRDVSDLSVVGMPIQANFRTNIVGTLLTQSEDYNIEIDANFGQPDIIPVKVSSWDEFIAALADGSCTYIQLSEDIKYESNYQLQKDITIDLNGNSMTLPMINIHKKTTVKNGTINGKVYARKNSDIIFDNVKFSGAVSDNLSTEGHLAIQSGCKLFVKACLFSPTEVSGSQTKPVSFEGGTSTMKFENCEFKSSPYKKQVYFNSLSATASLDFTNCNFNNKTPNIMFAAASPLTNLTMSGTTKLGSVTLEINRAKDAVTDADLAYLRTLIANNSISSVRLFYAGGSSEYIR